MFGWVVSDCEKVIDCGPQFQACYAVTANAFIKDQQQVINHIDSLDSIIMAGCWPGANDCQAPETIYDKYDPPDPQDVALAHGILDPVEQTASQPIDRNHHPLIHTNRSRTDGVFVAAELLDPNIQNHCIGYIEDTHRFTIKYNQTFCCCQTSACNRNVVLTSEKNPFESWSQRSHKDQNDHQHLTTMLATPYSDKSGNKGPPINGSMSISDREITALIIGTIGFFCLFVFLFLLIFYKKKLCSASKHTFPSLFRSASQSHAHDPAAMTNRHHSLGTGGTNGAGGLIPMDAVNRANSNDATANSPPVFSDHPFIQFKTLNMDRFNGGGGGGGGNHFYEEERQPFLMGSSNDPQLLKELYSNRKPSLGANNNTNIQGLPHFLQLQPAPTQPQQDRPDTAYFTDFKSIDDGCIPARLRAQDLKLVENIAHGKLSTVWKARCRNDESASPFEYAVKIFTPHQKSSWVNEREIFNILSMSMNENILKFISADMVEQPELTSSSTSDDQSSHPLSSTSSSVILEYWIITEYHSLGTLHDYLKANLISWRQMVIFADCILDGLSYLHSENLPNNASKTFSIAHRDIKSKNILVTRRGGGGELTCCLGDFGLALTLESTSKLASSEIRNKVGTSRYMSPELLEGAIAFTKETFLRKLQPRPFNKGSTLLFNFIILCFKESMSTPVLSFFGN